VKLFDGKDHAADIVGADAAQDVALVKMQGVSNLKFATLGDSAKLRVGDTVVAIGNALNLSGTPTVTQGIVSAKGRSITAGSVQLTDLIQTDAAINPGNSGGPLLDTAGEVVGINTAAIQNTQNIGFALEINHVKDVMAALKVGSTPQAGKAFLGVESASVSDLTSDQLAQYAITATSGAAVTGVQAGTAAADAGLRAGDVITELGGTKVGGTDDLRTAIGAHQPGDKVSITVQRGSSQETLEATLGTRPTTGG